MNIQDAKEQIRRTVAAYLSKDAMGDYRLPAVRQRPLFLLGAPGIGKTAIMEQVASEMHIGLLSYSMTHHTRQSAIGLPMLVQRTYEGKTYTISEYTMSEIIAAVYDAMENQHQTEGILFLDEINCVSETLAPAMLQFLQYKTFGGHAVPAGWVVVLAGNPPVYNQSAREFDIATLDRLKILEIEPDYAVWRRYAAERNLHPAILAYLDQKSNRFYQIESTPDGPCYVTARGWEDLSVMMQLYEDLEFPIDETLVRQYLHREETAQDFALFYDIWQKYRQDWQVDDILQGHFAPALREKAAGATFDEKLALTLQLTSRCEELCRNALETYDALKKGLPLLKQAAETDDPAAFLQQQASSLRQEIRPAGEEAPHRRRFRQELWQLLSDAATMCAASGDEIGTVLPGFFTQKAEENGQQLDRVGKALHELFAFLLSAFGEGQELLIAVTHMAESLPLTRYISQYGCDDFEYWSHRLLLDDRGEVLRGRPHSKGALS